ncbi:hypothetical protein ACSQ67_009592 [Phaseolus vulgaris]
MFCSLKGEVPALFWTCKIKKGLILGDGFECTKLKVYWASRRNCFVNGRHLDFEEAFTIFHSSRHSSTTQTSILSHVVLEPVNEDVDPMKMFVAKVAGNNIRKVADVHGCYYSKPNNPTLQNHPIPVP